MTRCPDCDALRLSLARIEGQLASADRSWIEMRDDLDRAIDARDAAHQAHADTQAMLGEVAERYEAELELARATRGSICREIHRLLGAGDSSPVEAMRAVRRAAAELQRIGGELDGARAEMRTLRRHRDLAEIHLDRIGGLTDVMLGVIERQGARVALRDAGIIARDRALDACAERIADLLGQHWPATLGRNLAMGGAQCMARYGGINLADGYWDWQPGRGKPHPHINDEEG